MQNLTFGIEIETVGITRVEAAVAIRRVVGGSIRHTRGVYDTYQVTDTQGRVWQAMSDSSLSGDRNHQAEIVSPILTASDIETVQEIVRSVKRAGAKVDATCGIHIHIGAAPFNTKKLTNLMKIINKQEALIERALGVSNSRRRSWCRGISSTFINLIDYRAPESLDDLNAAWYGYYNERPSHYDNSRYHGVNLHSVWYRGTIEFRWFNSTLHAGKVKAYIQFVLALAAKALASKSASSAKREFHPESAKYDFRVFLLRLGMIGDEFKTARKHLLSKLEGSSAWKNGSQMQRVA